MTDTGQMLSGQHLQFLVDICIIQQLWAEKYVSGKTCPLPGSLPHGYWTCEMQEIPIDGTSLLDEDAQSYPGKRWLNSSPSYGSKLMELYDFMS